MEDMLKDYVLGEHLLLVGNQVMIILTAKVKFVIVRMLSRGLEKTKLWITSSIL